jgi:transformation/transcription domain-associated protein
MSTVRATHCNSYLITLYASTLPKEEERHGEMLEFHQFVYSAFGEGLRNATSLPGVLGMLKWWRK